MTGGSATQGGGARLPNGIHALKEKLDPDGSISRRLTAEVQQIGRAGLDTFLEVLRFDNDDDREESAVYHALAHSIADDLGCTAEEAFPAIVRLCGGGGNPLAAQIPEPAEKVTAALRTWLVMIRLRYAIPRGGPYSRTIEIAFNGAQGLRQRTIDRPLKRFDLPRSVREEQFRAGRDEVAFRLYPRSA